MLNNVLKEDLEILYGEKTWVEITNLTYCEQKKHYSVQCKIYVSDVNLFMESDEDGLKFLISESFKYSGLEENIVAVTISVDIL